ncbi:MAG: hypothetical protein NZ699_03520 [Roseiflexus sp.]|nr:hypothetical protein [Roseiflexus sp.]MCS7288182.1 hypothetical protein [Roseiflexus sp.]MDW8145990.1 hypothetical protein [Roseiflexaceae bacterium]MDW8233005.1 hypothetical protein [Roseiflexaceae bacterium]
MTTTDRSDSLIDVLMRALQSASAAPADVADRVASFDPFSTLSPSPSLGLSVERLAAIVTMLAAAPTIVAATPPGVTKGRISALLAPEERRHAALIMEWLDKAGVLVEPRSEALRWREPRPFCSDDIDWIVARVRLVHTEAP